MTSSNIIRRITSPFYVRNTGASYDLFEVASAALKVRDTTGATLLTIDPSAKTFSFNGVLSDSVGSSTNWNSVYSNALLKNGSVAITSNWNVDGSGTLYIDKTHGRIGIGTTSPSSALDVYSSAAGVSNTVTISNTDNSTNNTEARLHLIVGGESAGDVYAEYSIIGIQDWVAGVDNSDGNKFKICSSAGLGSLDRLTVDTAGNVGIGTSSPGGILDIRNGVSMFGQTSGNGMGYAYQKDNTLNFLYEFNSDQAGYVNYYGYNGGATQFRDLSICDGKSNNILYVDGSTGRVGIGTTTPINPLQVSVPYAATDTTARGILFLSSNDSIAAGLAFQLIGGASQSVRTAVLQTLNAGTGATNAGNLSLQLYGGNVGIGTASPSAMLTVCPISHASSQSGGIQISANDGAWSSGIYLKSNSLGVPRIAFDVAGSPEVLTLAQSGNIGIGTTAPGISLDVIGQAWLNTQLSVYTSGRASGSALLFLQPNKIGVYPVGGGAGGGGLDFYTNGDTVDSRLHIDANGNVGIGTTSPDTNLHVLGSTTIQGTTDGKYELIVTGNGILSSDLSFKDVYNGSIRLWLDRSGNVGIGTVSPSAKLQVIGDKIESADNSGSNRYAMRMWNDTTYGYLDAYHFGTGPIPLVLQTNQGNTLVNPNGGNVGIGTTSPVALLHVYSAGGDSFERIEAGAHNAYLSLKNSVDEWQIGNELDGSFGLFKVGSVLDAIRVLANGNVGIGTTTPAFALDMGSSGIIATYGGTSTNWNSVYSNALLKNGSVSITSNWDVDGLHTLYIDKNDGYIGIGTNSPQTKLDVRNGLAFFGQSSASTDCGLSYFKDNTLNFYYTSSSNQIGYINYYGGSGFPGTTRDLGICDGYGEVILFVDGSTHYVGINTVIPTTALEIGASGVITTSGGTSTNWNSLLSSALKKDGSVSLTSNWDVDGAHTLYIDKNYGRIGAGTNTPQNTLDVNGYLRVYQPTSSSSRIYLSSDNNTYIEKDDFDSINIVNNTHPVLSLYNDGDGAVVTGTLYVNTMSPLQYSTISFVNNLGGGASISWDNTNSLFGILAMSIKTSTVGINNTSPFYALDVAGTIRATTGIIAGPSGTARMSKYLTMNTPNASTASLAHGSSASKIISCEVLISDASNHLFKSNTAGTQFSAGNGFDWYIDNTNIEITNIGSSLQGINTIQVVIWYTA